MRVCARVCMSVCARVCMSVCACLCVCVCVCVYIYIYIGFGGVLRGDSGFVWPSWYVVVNKFFFKKKQFGLLGTDSLSLSLSFSLSVCVKKKNVCL